MKCSTGDRLKNFIYTVAWHYLCGLFRAFCFILVIFYRIAPATPVYIGC
nr:MAG TPA: hypothetical protein [Caudoviricetes sp.]